MQVVTTVGLDIAKSHIADNPTVLAFVRYWTNSGHCWALTLID
jgi:hypothetical protein